MRCDRDRVGKAPGKRQFYKISRKMCRVLPRPKGESYGSVNAGRSRKLFWKNDREETGAIDVVGSDKRQAEGKRHLVLTISMCIMQGASPRRYVWAGKRAQRIEAAQPFSEACERSRSSSRYLSVQDNVRSGRLDVRSSEG